MHESAREEHTARDRASGSVSRVWYVALIIAVTAAAFSPVAGNGFVQWDDGPTILHNEAFRGFSPAHLRWMFTTFHMGHYQPLAWLSLALDHSIWGLDPRGFHLTNLLLHTASAIVLFAIAFALFGRVPTEAARAEGNWRERSALLAALFFAIHPLRVESVAWATERRDVLAGFFLLLALWAYLKRCEREGEGRRGGWYAFSVIALCLSLLAKAWGIVFPVLVLILDLFPLGRLPRRRGEGEGYRIRRVLVEKIPYLVLAALFTWLASAAQGGSAAFISYRVHGLGSRVAQAFYGLCFYPYKTMFPAGLSPFHMLRAPLDPLYSPYAPCAAAIIALSVALVIGRRRWPWALAGWASFAVIVSPVLGFAQAGFQLVADRYTYLSCIPFALLIGAGFLYTCERSARPGLIAAAAVALLLWLGALTWNQCHVWRNDLSLWEQAVKVDPTNSLALKQRGTARHELGDYPGAIGDYTRAIEGYAGMGDLDPGLIEAHINRAMAYEAVGDGKKAALDYALAVEKAENAEHRALAQRRLLRLRARLRSGGGVE